MITGFLLYGTSTIVNPNTAYPGPNWTGYKGEAIYPSANNTGLGSGGDPKQLSQLSLQTLHGSNWHQPAIITCSMPDGMWIADQVSNVIAIKAGTADTNLGGLQSVIVVVEGGTPVTIPGNQLTWNPDTSEWAFNVALDMTDDQKSRNLYGPVNVTMIAVPVNGYNWAITRTFYLGLPASDSRRAKYYVDPSTGIDDTTIGRGTLSSPFKSAQYAIGQATAAKGIGAIVYLQKGTHYFDWTCASITNVTNKAVVGTVSPHLITVKPYDGLLKSDVTITKSRLADGTGSNPGGKLGYGYEKQTSASATSISSLSTCALQILFKSITIDTGPFWDFYPGEGNLTSLLNKKIYFQNFTMFDSLLGPTGLTTDPISGVSDPDGSENGGFGAFGSTYTSLFGNDGSTRRYFDFALMEGDMSVIDIKGSASAPHVRRNIYAYTGSDALYKNPGASFGKTDITGLPCQDADNFCNVNCKTIIKSYLSFKSRLHDHNLLRVTGVTTYQNAKTVQSIVSADSTGTKAASSITTSADAAIGDPVLHISSKTNVVANGIFNITDSNNVTTQYSFSFPTAAQLTAHPDWSDAIVLNQVLKSAVLNSSTINIWYYSFGTLNATVTSSNSGPLRYGVSVVTFDMAPPNAVNSPTLTPRTSASGVTDDVMRFVTGKCSTGGSAPITGGSGSAVSLQVQYQNDGLSNVNYLPGTNGGGGGVFGFPVVGTAGSQIRLDDGTLITLAANQAATIGNLSGNYQVNSGDYLIMFNNYHTDIDQIITTTVGVPNQRNWWYENYLALGTNVNTFLMQPGQGLPAYAVSDTTLSVTATGALTLDGSPTYKLRAGDLISLIYGGNKQYNMLLWVNADGTQGQLDYPFVDSTKTATSIPSGTAYTKYATCFGWMRLNCAQRSQINGLGQLNGACNIAFISNTICDAGLALRGTCRGILILDSAMNQLAVAEVVDSTKMIDSSNVGVFADVKTLENLTVMNTAVNATIASQGMCSIRYLKNNPQGKANVYPIPMYFDALNTGDTKTMKIKAVGSTNLPTVTLDSNNNPINPYGLDHSARKTLSPVGAQTDPLS